MDWVLLKQSTGLLDLGDYSKVWGACYSDSVSQAETEDALFRGSIAVFFFPPPSGSPGC